MKILSTRLVWKSNDEQKKIYEVIDDQGNTFKTWNEQIGTATKGSELEVKTYTKPGKDGETESWADLPRGLGRSGKSPEERASIERQNALTNAVNYCTSKSQFLEKKQALEELTGKHVIEVAHYFQKFTSGSMTVEDTKKPTAVTTEPLEVKTVWEERADELGKNVKSSDDVSTIELDELMLEKEPFEG